MKNPHAVALGRLGGLKGGLARSAALSTAERREVARRAAAARWEGKFPELLRSLFWDYPFDELRLPAHRSEVLMKVLSYGRPDQIAWARRRFGDQQIRRWIRERKGRGLLPTQVVLWVSKSTSNRWLAADPLARIWAER